MMNEVGDFVPPGVVAAAKRRGCHRGGRYVYRDGKYGPKCPAASIGGMRAARFQSDSYEDYKVVIAPGWVAFKSPSATNPRHSKTYTG